MSARSSSIVARQRRCYAGSSAAEFSRAQTAGPAGRLRDPQQRATALLRPFRIGYTAARSPRASAGKSDAPPGTISMSCDAPRRVSAMSAQRRAVGASVEHREPNVLHQSVTTPAVKALAERKCCGDSAPTRPRRCCGAWLVCRDDSDLQERGGPLQPGEPGHELGAGTLRSSRGQPGVAGFLRRGRKALTGGRVAVDEGRRTAAWARQGVDRGSTKSRDSLRLDWRRPAPWRGLGGPRACGDRAPRASACREFPNADSSRRAREKRYL